MALKTIDRIEWNKRYNETAKNIITNPYANCQLYRYMAWLHRLSKDMVYKLYTKGEGGGVKYLESGKPLIVDDKQVLTGYELIHPHNPADKPDLSNELSSKLLVNTVLYSGSLMEFMKQYNPESYNMCFKEVTRDV